MKHRRRPNPKRSSSQIASILLLLAIVLPPYLSLSCCSADETSNPILSRRASRMTADNVSGATASMQSQKPNEEELFSPSLSFASGESSDHITELKKKQLQRRLQNIQQRRREPVDLEPAGLGYTATGVELTKASKSPTSPSPKSSKTPSASNSKSPTSPSPKSSKTPAAKTSKSPQ